MKLSDVDVMDYSKTVPAPMTTSARPLYLSRVSRLLSKSAFTLPLALALAGCTQIFNEPAPEKVSSKESWQVHCETASSHRPTPEKLNEGVKKPLWLLGLDTNNEPFELRGDLEDGFLHLGPTQPTAHELRMGCIRALTKASREKANEIARIMAFRPKEKINVAIQYPEDQGASISRLIIFGDSLSDTGNMKARLRVFPTAPYWIGRFSNGPAWPDYIGSLSYLAIGNHSVGGASVTGKATIPKVTLKQRIMDGGQFFVSGTTAQQIEVFKESFMNGDSLSQPEKTAVMIWGGANDYIAKEPFSGAIETLLDRLDSPEGYPKVVATVINGLEQQIRSLVALDARRILIGNLPDLGLSPIVLENTTYAAESSLSETERRIMLANKLSDLTHLHNQLLAEMVARLEDEYSDISFLLFDAHTLFDDILNYDSYPHFDIKQYSDFDVNELATPLESEDDKTSKVILSRCYTGGYLGETDASFVCNNVERAVFWDVVHPTTYVHCWIAVALQQRMNTENWTRKTPNMSEVGEWCGGIADILAGHEELRVMHYTTAENAMPPTTAN
jgi:thermolabile hemolysin